MITVLVIDDHAMLAESLVRLLEEDPEIEVIGSATTAGAGLERARIEQPDIVLMDFALPDMDGAAATRLLKQTCPAVKVITLTGADRPGAYYAAMEAGSSACVNKTRSIQDLRSAVYSVYRGESVANDELAALPALGELIVHYQPIVDLATTGIIGFEALVRWQHAYRGLVPPGEFLPRAEETGFINELGRHVGTSACRQLASWRRQLGPVRGLWVSVNMSASAIKQPRTSGDVATLLAVCGIPPSALVLEITESVLMDDPEAALTQFERLKELGVRIALDDFGTGYSSLSYLQRFPFDVVKIDRSFTSELPDSNRALRLAESVQQLASGLGILGIAEGVERQEQADVLRDIGWTCAQGFLYSRPVDAAAATAMLRSHAAMGQRPEHASKVSRAQIT